MMAVKGHDHAFGCRHAQYPFRMSIERAMDSPMEADPIHMMECSGVGDGAAALVLVPAGDSGIEVAGSAMATDCCSIAARKDPLVFEAVRKASEKAYRMAGVEAGDIDVAEVHDDYTIDGILSLESLGFAEQGGAAKLVAGNATDKDGEIPVNTFGGLKARGHPLGATGLYQLAEVALQLKGAAGDHQVPGAKVGLAQCMGGLASVSAVNILRRLEP
jgi:acetyl-CoA C-acetyltransferase